MTMSNPNDLSILPSAGSPRRRTLLHHQAVTDLGIAIVSGELPEGVPLPIESELGKRLGVSRTVVREATKVLASKGLLRSRPKVGTVPLPRVSWDVLDPEVAPGVGPPVRGGLSYREAHLAMELIAESALLDSLEVVEVNPILDRENETAKLAVELVASALGARVTESARA